MAGLTADSLLEPLSLRRKLYVNVGVDGMSSVLKLVYGAPHLVLHPVMLLVSLYAVEYYLSVGATYGYLVLGVALGRAVDIVLTPFMASTTDAFRSFYGRRKPFIFVAVLFYCLMLLLLFTPPSSFSGTQKAVWFCLSHIGFVVGHVFLAVPYDALGMELASSYDDRSSLWWLCALFQYVGNFALLLVCLALPLVKYNSPGNASSSLGSRSQSCSADSCYSATGVGTSCRAYYPLPWKSGASSYRDDGQAPQLEFQQFVIFNATQWAAQPSSATALAAAFASSPSAAAAKYGQCRVGIGSTGQVYSTPSELFQPAACLESGALRSSGCISAYCQCLSSCQALCAQDSRSSGTVLGAVLVASGLLLLSVFTALGWLQERALLKAPLSLLPAPGTAGALLSVLHNNPALRALLLPWFLDSLVQALTLGLLGYYVRLLVKPSEQRRALHGVECNGGLGSGLSLPAGGNLFESEALCKGDTATGALLASYFLAAVAGCCLWRLAVSRWGKKIAWVATSLASFATLLCWVGVGVSALPSSANSPSLPAALGVVLLMGAASGGQWITDSMVADAVEYHEFLTGQRLEAACSLWRSLLPKLASVCAVALPVASLWSLGMLPPVAGLDQLSSPSQPDTVRIYIVAVGAALPAALALVSAWIKCGYPLRSRQGVRLVGEGVGLHLQHAAAMDPLTGLDYEREHWETLGGLLSVDAGDGEKGRESRSQGQGQGQGQGQPADQRNAWLQRVLLMDCFPSLEDAQDYLTTTAAGFPLSTPQHLSSVARDDCALAFMLASGAVVALALTAGWLGHPGKSAAVLVFILLFAAALLWLLLSGERLKAASVLRALGRPHRTSPTKGQSLDSSVTGGGGDEQSQGQGATLHRAAPPGFLYALERLVAQRRFFAAVRSAALQQVLTESPGHVALRRLRAMARDTHRAKIKAGAIAPEPRGQTLGLGEGEGEGESGEMTDVNGEMMAVDDDAEEQEQEQRWASIATTAGANGSGAARGSEADADDVVKQWRRLLQSSTLGQSSPDRAPGMGMGMGLDQSQGKEPGLGLGLGLFDSDEGSGTGTGAGRPVWPPQPQPQTQTGSSIPSAWQLELVSFLREQREIHNGLRPPYRTLQGGPDTHTFNLKHQEGTDEEVKQHE